MPIIPWRPFWEIEKWFEEEWPESEWSEFRFPKVRTPRMDIYEEGDNIVAEVELPGIDPKNIEVEVKDNVLRIEAKEEEKKEVKEKGYFKREIGRKYFKRQVLLPAEVQGDKTEAEYADGILKVRIPKTKPKDEKKKIKIKVKTK
jgi:HSP20 family protein